MTKGFAKSALAAGLLSFAATSSAVIIQGTEWRQLAETGGFSWNDVATVCPIGGGLCSGSLRNTSFDGWNWANVFEVGELLGVLTPHPGNSITIYQEDNSQWAPDFLQLFAPTFSDGQGYEYAHGWTATRVAPTNTSISFVGGVTNNTITPDEAFNGRNGTTTQAGESRGVWLYRSAAIPEPTTLTLACLGLAGLYRTTRRTPQ